MKVDAFPDQDLKHILLEAEKEINESYMESTNEMFKMHEVLRPKCSDLPKKISEKNICYHAGFVTQLKAVWTLFTTSKKYITDCLIRLIGYEIFGRIIKVAFTMVLKIIGNIVGLLIVTAIKILYFIVKMFYFIYKGVNELDRKKRSADFGDAAGTAVKIVLSIVGLRKKRKLF